MRRLCKQFQRIVSAQQPGRDPKFYTEHCECARKLILVYLSSKSELVVEFGRRELGAVTEAIFDVSKPRQESPHLSAPIRHWMSIVVS
jgi:hypothetical protein